MIRSLRALRGCVALTALLIVPATRVEGADDAYRSHSPTRPLPTASERPPAAGPARYVDPADGDDENEGTESKPWRTVSHAVKQLRPGDTLFLRGGTYYEHVTLTASGTAEQPITIRAYPGELAVLDGGLREFFEEPVGAWEPVPDGAPGEFRSTETYPQLEGRNGRTSVLGNFGDSMVPLHGYRFLTDLRSDNEYFSKFEGGKTEAGSGIYCGPGVWFDAETGRIHIRLAHTHQDALGEENYRGETDPRKLPLVVAGRGPGAPLTIDGARYVRLQDLVVRGSAGATVVVSEAANIEFDGVTAYGGSAPFQVRDTHGLRLVHCACRGIAAPWTWRGSLKYRAIESRLFSASGWSPTGNDSRDFELAYSEFTDSVDGVFVGNVRRVRFHHNLLDNVSDDGIFLTAGTAYDGTTPGGEVEIYQNVLARCLTTFAFGVGHGRQKMTAAGKQTGAGVRIYRNVFDFRRPVMYHQPGPGEGQITSYGRVASDHGSPAWEPMTVYHNDVVCYDDPSRGDYGAGLGGHVSGGTRRKVFNNIFLQVEGTPGQQLPEVVLPSKPGESAQASQDKRLEDPLAKLLDGDVGARPKKPRTGDGGLAASVDADAVRDLEKKLAARQASVPLPIDFQADGNLHWSISQPPQEFLEKFRKSPEFEASKKLYGGGWTAHDVAADPKFARFTADWREPLDLRLSPDSPAVDAGVPLPAEWPDPLRSADRGKPDIGALPVGAEPWRVGVRGRLNAFGQAVEPLKSAEVVEAKWPISEPGESAEGSEQKVAIVEGYPAFDAPLLRFALRRHGFPIDDYEKEWLDTADYSKYDVVVVVGNLARAGIEHDKYTPRDLEQVEQFLRRGGTLLLMRENGSAFATPEGREFLTKFAGSAKPSKEPDYQVLEPDHPWLRHLKGGRLPAWIVPQAVVPLGIDRGERLLGSPSGHTLLCRVPLGQGQLIYVGWPLARSLPSGRRTSTVEQERTFEEQMKILLAIVSDLGEAR